MEPPYALTEVRGTLCSLVLKILQNGALVILLHFLLALYQSSGSSYSVGPHDGFFLVCILRNQH